jgi:hypothetical protein
VVAPSNPMYSPRCVGLNVCKTSSDEHKSPKAVAENFWISGPGFT